MSTAARLKTFVAKPFEKDSKPAIPTSHMLPYSTLQEVRLRKHQVGKGVKYTKI